MTQASPGSGAGTSAPGPLHSWSPSRLDHQLLHSVLHDPPRRVASTAGHVRAGAHDHVREPEQGLRLRPVCERESGGKHPTNLQGFDETSVRLVIRAPGWSAASRLRHDARESVLRCEGTEQVLEYGASHESLTSLQRHGPRGPNDDRRPGLPLTDHLERIGSLGRREGRVVQSATDSVLQGPQLEAEDIDLHGRGDDGAHRIDVTGPIGNRMGDGLS